MDFFEFHNHRFSLGEFVMNRWTTVVIFYIKALFSLMKHPKTFLYILFFVIMSCLHDVSHKVIIMRLPFALPTLFVIVLLFVFS